jgi:hypothetical protein
MAPPLMLLTPFLSTQPKISKGQKNCIKVLYDGVVHSFHKASATACTLGSLGAIIRYLSS